MQTSRNFNVARDQWRPNTRDLRERMSDQELSTLPSIVVGREVTFDPVCTGEDGDLYNYNGYLEDLREHHQPSGIKVHVPEGGVMAVLCSADDFVGAVLSAQKKTVSPTSRRAHYEMHSAKDRFRKSLEVAKHKDKEQASEMYSRRLEVIQSGDYDDESLVHLGPMDSSQELERMGAMTVHLRPKPRVVTSTTHSTTLGFAVQNDVRMGDGNRMVRHAFSESRLLHGNGLPEEYLVPAGTVERKLSSGRDNAGPELLSPPTYIRLGPVTTVEVTDY